MMNYMRLPKEGINCCKNRKGMLNMEIVNFTISVAIVLAVIKHTNDFFAIFSK